MRLRGFEIAAAHRAGDLPSLVGEVIASAEERRVPRELIQLATGQTRKQISNHITHATEPEGREARAAFSVPQFELNCSHQLVALYVDAINALVALIRSRVRIGEKVVPGIFHTGLDAHTYGKYEGMIDLIRWLNDELEMLRSVVLRSVVVPHSEQTSESDQTSEEPR